MKNIFVILLVISIAISCKKEDQKEVSDKWENISGPNLKENEFYSLAVLNGNLFALEIDFQNNHNLYCSTDNGQSWSLISQIPDEINDLAAWGNSIFLGTTHGIFQSNDYGKSWESLNTGLPLFGGYRYIDCDKIIVEAKLYTFYWLNSSVYSFNGNSWNLVLKDPNVTKPIYIEAFTALDKQIFIGVMDGVFQSSDGGINWTEINTKIILPQVLTHMGQNIIVGSNSGIYFSPDGKKFNKSVIDNQTDLTPRVYEFAINGKSIYAGTTNGVLVSTDKGETWHSFIDGLPNFTAVPDLAVSDGVLYAATNKGVWKRKL